MTDAGKDRLDKVRLVLDYAPSEVLHQIASDGEELELLSSLDRRLSREVTARRVVRTKVVVERPEVEVPVLETIPGDGPGAEANGSAATPAAEAEAEAEAAPDATPVVARAPSDPAEADGEGVADAQAAPAGEAREAAPEAAEEPMHDGAGAVVYGKPATGDGDGEFFVEAALTAVAEDEAPPVDVVAIPEEALRARVEALDRLEGVDAPQYDADEAPAEPEADAEAGPVEDAAEDAGEDALSDGGHFTLVGAPGDAAEWEPLHDAAPQGDDLDLGDLADLDVDAPAPADAADVAPEGEEALDDEFTITPRTVTEDVDDEEWPEVEEVDDLLLGDDEAWPDEADEAEDDDEAFEIFDPADAPEEVAEAEAAEADEDDFEIFDPDAEADDDLTIDDWDAAEEPLKAPAPAAEPADMQFELVEELPAEDAAAPDEGTEWLAEDAEWPEAEEEWPDEEDVVWDDEPAAADEAPTEWAALDLEADDANAEAEAEALSEAAPEAASEPDAAEAEESLELDLSGLDDEEGAEDEAWPDEADDDLALDVDLDAPDAHEALEAEDEWPDLDDEADLPDLDEAEEDWPDADASAEAEDAVEEPLELDADLDEEEPPAEPEAPAEAAVDSEPAPEPEPELQPEEEPEAAPAEAAREAPGEFAAHTVDADGPLPVTELAGVGSIYAGKLDEEGIRTTEDLVGGDPWQLSQDTGIATKLLEQWVRTAEFMQVLDLPKETAELLARAGVAGVSGLADADVDEVAQRINSIVAGGEVPGAKPVTAEQVADWKQRSR